MNNKANKKQHGDLSAGLLNLLRVTNISAREIASLFSAPRGSMLNYHTGLGSALNYENKKAWEKDKGESIVVENAQKIIDIFESKKQLYKCINNLKQQGLINESEDKKLAISPKGERKRKKLHEARRLRFPDYRVLKDDVFKIISFDIPEEKRKQRDWLREVLKNLEFELLHQSTWIGNSKIPEEFLDDLAFRGIFKYTKILAVTHKGNYEKIKQKSKK